MDSFRIWAAVPVSATGASIIISSWMHPLDISPYYDILVTIELNDKE
jgi:hypothetical protein